MAARTQGYSLFLSDICYTPSRNFLFSLPPVARSLGRDCYQRVANLLQE
jgi:hypothetical protein